MVALVDAAPVVSLPLLANNGTTSKPATPTANLTATMTEQVTTIAANPSEQHWRRILPFAG